MTTSEIGRLLQQMIGQRCERAENPHGSILSLDIGPLGPRNADEPDARTHGWRHLTVLSPWRLQTRDEVICDWNTDGGSRGLIQPVIQQLVGLTVKASAAEPPAWDLRVEWSNGWLLKVFGDSTNDRDDAWFILGTDGVEVGAVPIVRSVTG